MPQSERRERQIFVEKRGHAVFCAGWDVGCRDPGEDTSAHTERCVERCMVDIVFYVIGPSLEKCVKTLSDD